ncbi:uncharacterized protein LOC119568612 [Penaeus monodon]|uniref:uncharacterized protein LOC119568612 n=1 Tax=Penaeus monodon TaxID=6687 RepID=UPI0018A7BFCF|nr:uncharacterized protein LOC119568612 [Penaeus monodon]
MIRTSITSKLENLPTGHSDRTMSMRLPLKNKQYATLFSVYALTLQAKPAQKDRFYLELRGHLQSIPADDKVILAISTPEHGVGNYNNNGRLLLELCTEQQLVITNTIFQQKDRLKTTWMHPRSKHWHLIDYVLVRQKDLKDVLHTRVMPSAECHTALQTQADLQSKLESVDCRKDPSPETLWDQLKTAILQTSEEVLGFTTKRNKDWFDENNQEIQELLTKKRENSACADTGDYRGFYEALKAVYGPTHHVQSPLRSADGQALFTDKTSILSRWSEHFQALFSADHVVQDSAVLRIRQKPVIEELEELPSIEEISKAIEQLKCGKAAGVDGIPPEIWKDGGPTLHSKLHELLVCCWEQSKLPRNLHDAVIITLYKNKGEKSDCSNYRGITLLSIAGKVFARVLLNRLLPTIAEDHFPETQCGFRTNRGTTDMVFVLRQLQEKCREQNKGLYVTFVDLTKTFDTVSRKGLWMIMERLAAPQSSSAWSSIAQ